MEIWAFSDFPNIEEVFKLFSELSFYLYDFFIFFLQDQQTACAKE